MRFVQFIALGGLVAPLCVFGAEFPPTNSVTLRNETPFRLHYQTYTDACADGSACAGVFDAYPGFALPQGVITPSSSVTFELPYVERYNTEYGTGGTNWFVRGETQNTEYGDFMGNLEGDLPNYAYYFWPEGESPDISFYVSEDGHYLVANEQSFTGDNIREPDVHWMTNFSAVKGWQNATGVLQSVFNEVTNRFYEVFATNVQNYGSSTNFAGEASGAFSAGASNGVYEMSWEVPTVYGNTRTWSLALDLGCSALGVVLPVCRLTISFVILLFLFYTIVDGLLRNILVLLGLPSLQVSGGTFLGTNFNTFSVPMMVATVLGIAFLVQTMLGAFLLNFGWSMMMGSELTGVVTAANAAYEGWRGLSGSAGEVIAFCITAMHAAFPFALAFSAMVNLALFYVIRYFLITAAACAIKCAVGV